MSQTKNSSLQVEKSGSEQELKLGDYEKVKFTFEGLDKYIVMELNTRIALEDLKFTFASILKTDFFAKRLKFILSAPNQEPKELPPQKSLCQQIIEKKYKPQQLKIIVRFEEEGA